MITPTKEQADVLRFIAGYIEAHGQSPTFTEMASGLGLASRATPHRHVERLEERGALRNRGKTTGQIQLVEPVALPRAPDGEPLFFVRIGESAR